MTVAVLRFILILTLAWPPLLAPKSHARGAVGHGTVWLSG